MVVALLPGGFKPPHAGHYEAAKYLAKYADEVLIKIGPGNRGGGLKYEPLGVNIEGGITPEISKKFWEIYKKYDNDSRKNKLKIEYSSLDTPVRDVYDYIENPPKDVSKVVLGLGEKENDTRYQGIPEAAEASGIEYEIVRIPPQSGGASGSNTRDFVITKNKEDFFNSIPNFLPPKVKENMWNLLTKQVKLSSAEEKDLKKKIASHKSKVRRALKKKLTEFMGGTMNKEEMAKHLANMKKLRKFFSKQGDQMVPVPTDLTKGLKRKLYEGRYDQETTRLSRYLINMFKAEFGNLYVSPRGDTGEEWDWPEQGIITTSKGKGLDFDFDFQFIPSKYDKENQLKGLLPFIVKGEGDGDGLEVIIIYEPKAFADDPKNWNDLVAEIKDTIRHEMEHVAQGLLGTKGVTLTGKKQGKGFKYYTAPEEIPAFVQGLYKQAKTRKIPFSQMVDKFLDERELEFNNEKEIEKVKQIWTDYARKNLPKAQLENFPPYKANQVQQTRYKASDTFTNDRKKAKKLGYIEEMKLFSKEWWSEIIMEELLNEGGAAGHMAHPFDLPNVNTGKELIDIFKKAKDSLKKQPGSVKIDGVNTSIRLINNAGKRQFAMDRGSKKELDLRGVTKADLEARFGAGHGMIKAGGDVLDIFNDAIPSIQEELEALGMWDNPNIMFNMEYVSGKSNVQDYGKNFLAIHGLLEVETKEVEGARGTLTKRVTSEKNFAQSDMDELLKKLEPFAKKKGFEIYGSVPTTFTKEPDFNKELNQSYTIDFAKGDQTKTLQQWLDGVTNIPKTDQLKMNVNGVVKDVGALSKQVYFAVFGGENVDDLFDNKQDIQKAIQGATTYLATEKLGDAILDVLDSPMGSVNNHEGIVIRDTKIFDGKPFKITGKFITGGVSSQFQQK